MTESSHTPLTNVNIRIYREEHNQIVYEDFFISDAHGKTIDIPLWAPPATTDINKENYASYQVDIRVNDFETQIVQGVQIYADTYSYLTLSMKKTREQNMVASTDIIAEKASIDMFNMNDSCSPFTKSRIRQRKPLLDQTIKVHLGEVDEHAENMTLSLLDYMKNIASCNLDSTWSHDNIKTHILAQFSFIQQRLLTAWYPSQGYTFDITNTINDLLFMKNHNIYVNIATIVDEIEQELYLQKNQKASMLNLSTEEKVKVCENTIPQSTDHSIFINMVVDSTSIAGYKDTVQSVQNQLQTISIYYPAIPEVKANGDFDPATRNSLTAFQRMLGIPADGCINGLTIRLLHEMYEELIH